MASLWQEVRRRNVVRVAIAYAVLAWVVIQVASTVFPALSLPAWTVRLVAVLLMIGFPIALILAWVFEITPEGVRRTDDISESSSNAHVSGHRLNYVITGLLVIAVGLLVYDNFIAATRVVTPADVASSAAAPSEPNAAPGTSTGASTDAAMPSIAVLNFVNGSPDPEQDYFVTGLSEQLRDTLSRLQGLQVVGSTSSTYFEGRDADLRTIGERLNVGHVLEGSIRKAGSALRISARLTAVDSGFQVWSDTYERTIDDVFEVQDDIATAVAQALQITLGVGELGRQQGMTRNVAAYEEFVIALGLFRESQPDSMLEAARHYERAVEIDPSFSWAWVMLANVGANAAFMQPDEAEEWRAKARAAMDRAEALSPDWPLVAATRANEELARGNFLAAGRYVEEQLPGVAVNAGNSAGIAFARGTFMLQAGKAREAIRAFERARAEDPLSVPISVFLAEAYANSGALDASLAEFDRGLGIGGFAVFVNASALVTALGTNDRAEVERRLAAAGPGAENFNARLSALLDDPADAIRFLRDRLVSTPVEPLPYLVIAQWSAYFGDPEMALELLQRIAARGDAGGDIARTIWRPAMRSVRRLDGFRDLVEDLGLVDYWREYGWPDACRPSGENGFTCE